MKKRWKILIGIALFLVILNFALEPVAKHYVNKALKNIEGYEGHVEDIDIALWRGAYKIENLELVKTDGEFPEPFVNIDVIDTSIEWAALFKGAIVGEIVLENPRLNFTQNEKGETQTGEDESWLKALDELLPIRINRFQIINGQINYRDLSKSPKVDVSICEMDMLATNLSSVQNSSDKLPSHAELSAKTSGKGKLTFQADMNVLKEVPDFDLNIELTELQLTYLKDFTEAYGKFKFKKGHMNLFTEVAMEDKKYEGYVKPIMKEISVIDLDDPQTSFWRKAWQVALGTTFELFENQPRDQFATKVPFDGTVKDTEVGVLPTLANVLRNAFIDAFEGQIDQSINIDSVNDKEKESDDGFFDFLKPEDNEK